MCRGEKRVPRVVCVRPNKLTRGLTQPASGEKLDPQKHKKKLQKQGEKYCDCSSKGQAGFEPAHFHEGAWLSGVHTQATGHYGGPRKREYKRVSQASADGLAKGEEPSV